MFQMSANLLDLQKHLRNCAALPRIVVPNVDCLTYSAEYSRFVGPIIQVTVRQIDKRVWRTFRR